MRDIILSDILSLRSAMMSREERNNMNNSNASRQDASLALSEKRVYSINEAADILGVGRAAVYSLCRQKVFHSVRVGSTIRISKPSFDAWLKQN